MGSHPDSNLHPVATGPAKALVDAHQAPQPLKLYSGWFCPFVQRVWALLEEKNIPYQYIEVNPYDKPPSLLALNPRGLVPTLQYDSRPLYESAVICEFLEEAYPGCAPRLMPEDVYARAKTRIWVGFCTGRVVTGFHRFLQWQPSNKSSDGGGDGEEGGLERVRGEFLGVLKELTQEMMEHGEGPFFFGGQEPSLIDFVVAPWIIRLWIFDHFKGGLGIPPEGQGGEDEALWARFRKWKKALEERPSIRDTTSEREFYLPIYQRYADDTAQSELAKATRTGRGVP
ncbi:hypothetical protein M409DRAFT_36094 [Zasmidium cellare ATCC 36951]|uniref:GST N-terminal domain-containing protein n=1 Tax=Zasmidium cellare ATCC 36951 TaxID=1080233 RepID=A0A6A6CUW0_ZASCE|nr:uncharacterized protein M409DRAFT_36094 [Zasmidium cellare ATCC 36951]KAF2169612.1 hypothetical protein M409DRAFT_36094 [Zasmidium cellare ATCC 36951]